MDINAAIDVASYALTAVGASSILAAVLPRDPRVAWVFRVLDLLAANWMNARNGTGR
jgi:hypothetical protein